MGDQPQTLKPAGRMSVLGACLFVLVLIVGMEVQKHREDAQASNPMSFPISEPIPEARLAAIQLGRRPLWSDPTVERLAWLLDLLAADCTGNTRRDLAGLTVNSLRELRSNGISASPAQVLGGVAGLDDIGRLPVCKPYFERYVETEREHPSAP